MKNIHLYLWGLLMLLVSCGPENRVIEKPVFLASNTTSIEVSKVTQTDSTTVLDIFARYRAGYWIKIASSSTLTDDKGNTYPIQAGIGIELDKEFWMPESGEAEFQIVFPPLKRGAKYVDFAEGPEVERGWRIWGIQLKGDQLPELRLPKGFKEAEVDKSATLSGQELRFGKATIKGWVLDYKEGMPDKVSVMPYNPFTGLSMDKNSDVALDADGSFSCTLDVMGCAQVIVSYADNTTTIFAAPDEVSEVCINLRELSRMRSKYHWESEPYGKSVYYNGPLASLVQEYKEINSLLFPVQDKFAIPQAKIMGTSVEDYKAAQINIWEAAKGAIGQSDLSPSTKEYALAEAATRVVSNISQVSGNYVSAFFRANPEAARDEYVAYGQKILKSLPSDYYVVTEEMAQILNSPVAIMTNAYPTIVGSVNDVDFGMEDGLLKQMAKVRSIFAALSEFQPLTEAQKEEMKTLPEACQQYLTAKNEELLATLEANKKKSGFRINEAGEVADEDLFASIISKFDGKVRLVDFWATWCGPCRMANKEMIPMKEDLKDKDIVYIYITGETSPKGTWENMIPDIHGEHFRVTDKQWSYLCDKYGVEGVPTYIVVDTEGEIKYKSVGFPGVSKMKEELLKAAVK